jgi:hypothetical protein
MTPQAESKLYRVWALDDSVYGPVTCEVLRDWVRDERILPDSWIFCETTRRWLTAGRMSELQVLFGGEDIADSNALLKPAVLRRIRSFGELTDDDLAEIVRLGELVQFPAFHTIMRANTPSDSIYFVIDGQVRQRIMVRGREILIAVKEAGSAFGYISLFDGGPHITDAVSDSPVTLFRVPTDKFRQLCSTRPEIGVPVLFSLGRALAARIRSDDRHLYEMVVLNQTRG